MSTKDKISWKFIVFCLVVFVVTFTSTYIINQIVLVDEDNLSAINTNSIPVLASEENINQEIALIFFGCSTCAAARSENLPFIIQQLSDKVREEAIFKGYGYIMIGVSKENNIEEGLDYLLNIADFDEISLGNGMGNTALQHYVWDTYDHALSTATPQIILSSRVYDTLSSGESMQDVHPEIISEEILWREIGVNALERLANSDNLLGLF